MAQINYDEYWGARAAYLASMDHKFQREADAYHQRQLQKMDVALLGTVMGRPEGTCNTASNAASNRITASDCCPPFDTKALQCFITADHRSRLLLLCQQP